MKLRSIVALLFVLLSTCSYAHAQVISNDTPIRYVASLPATCNPNSKPQAMVYKYTTAGGSRGLYYCSASNTWTVTTSGGGGGSVASLSNTYSNSLATAISSIGSAPTALLVDANTSCSTSLTIPSTLYLVFTNKAKITKSTGCSITFQGIGLSDPKSTIPAFSGFAAGDITFTGTAAGSYPPAISTELFDTGNTSLSDRLLIANAAFGTTQVKIICYPRVLTKNVPFSANKDIEFTDGDYTNTFAWTSGPNQLFSVVSNVHIHGSRGARLFEGSGLYAARIVGPVDPTASYTNIIVEGLSFIGVVGGGVGDGSGSTIILGNATHSAIRYNYFEDVHSYGAVLGGASSSGNYAYQSEISHNTFIKAGQQIVAMVNGKDIQISDNYIDGTGNSEGGGLYIDVEPNSDTDQCSGIVVQNNVLIDKDDNNFSNNLGGINVQAAGGIAQVTDIVIRGNTILGKSPTAYPPFASTSTGIAADGVFGLTVADNTIQSAAGHAIAILHSRNVQLKGNFSIGAADFTGYSAAFRFLAVADGVAESNAAMEVPQYDAATGLLEAEQRLAATSTGSVITVPVVGGAKFFSFDVGLQAAFNGTVYTISSFNNSTQALTMSASVGTVTTKTWTSGNVNTGTDAITITAHGYATGAQVTLSTTGALPAHTPPSTFPTIDGVAYYYVIKVDNDTIKLANSLANALANTPIDLTTTGSGTGTVTPMIETRFSNNTYQNNILPDGYSLVAQSSTSHFATFVNPAVSTQTLTDATTIVWSTNSGNVATVTLGGNRTMAAPTGIRAGGSYILKIVQDGTGSRTLTWNSVFKWPGGTAPGLTTTAAAVDLVTCASADGTNLLCNLLNDVK